MKVKVVFLLIQLLWIACLFKLVAPEETDRLELQLRRRHLILKQLALTTLSDDFHRPPHCPLNRIIFPDQWPFGQTGNIMITLVHALWMARKIDATVVLADWMEPLFVPFNSSVFRSIYCITSDQKIPPNAKVTSVRAGEAFRGHKLKKYLPFLNTYHFSEDWPHSYQSPLIQELSRHFLQVYAALWCCPNEELLHLTMVVLRAFFDSSLGYTAVHKRSFEGFCEKVYHRGIEILPQDFPVHHNTTTATTAKEDSDFIHPLCHLSPAFLRETFQLHHRNTNLSNTFLAEDGQSDVTHYLEANTVVSKIVEGLFTNLTHSVPLNRRLLSYYPHINPTTLREQILHPHSSIALLKDPEHLPLLFKYLDMLLLMHADFSILSPYSTFSFQVYVIRIALGLSSVPFVQHNDLFLQSVEQMKKDDRSLWVSPLSILEASLSL